mmetsp:Transcript_4259/g.10604  ORF Transcript_4259/g.10604 Transcript_4259/m.10604 type:complete len:262 (-) Transcript_4259:250-1035(-)
MALLAQLDPSGGTVAKVGHLGRVESHGLGGHVVAQLPVFVAEGLHGAVVVLLGHELGFLAVLVEVGPPRGGLVSARHVALRLNLLTHGDCLPRPHLSVRAQLCLGTERLEEVRLIARHHLVRERRHGHRRARPSTAVAELHLRPVVQGLRGRVRRAGRHVIGRVALGARGPGHRQVDTELLVWPVLAALLHHDLDLHRVLTLESEHEHLLQRLQRRHRERLRPPLVVEVVGGQRVVRRVHEVEDLRRRLLAPDVLVRVVLE